MAERTTIVVQSGDMDKMYSALIIANGAAAMGMDVWMFFTFWGLARLKRRASIKCRYPDAHAGLGQVDGSSSA
jgi:peroxiredoxin family protein